ncbi:hypothetical protein KKG36_02665, partial [Patescibacteria group bacterium]|nr:hypothetical protein [Patescibacteria group bacterium]
MAFALNVVYTFISAVVSSVIAFMWVPCLTRFLYKHKLWKKEARTKTISGEDAAVFNRLHKDRETRAPRMG